MNRRDAFKLFAAGAVSLLGMKGLAETLARPKSVEFFGGGMLGFSEAQPLGPVMGEQAHWSELSDGPLPNWDAVQLGKHSKVTSVRFGSQWVDTSEWPEESLKQLLRRPSVLKRMG